jgi:hypothetical protein
MATFMKAISALWSIIGYLVLIYLIGVSALIIGGYLVGCMNRILGKSRTEIEKKRHAS